VVLVALAILFYQLGAPFLAALEVIVYAGAIVVLFLFVIMMINPAPESLGSVAKLTVWFGPLILVGILAGQFGFLLSHENAKFVVSPVDIELLGRTFFSDYAYSLHLVALFLLVGLVGAMHLGSRGDQA